MDRPLECGQCKKDLKVVYKEVQGKQMSCCGMCETCPVLAKKLQAQKGGADEAVSNLKLVCGNCQTSLESVKTENILGCAECYSVFDQVIVEELIAENKLPVKLKNAIAQRTVEILQGTKIMGPMEKIESSDQLNQLNRALNEALKQENYEQAAVLRDQIKALREKKNDSKQ